MASNFQCPLLLLLLVLFIIAPSSSSSSSSSSSVNPSFRPKALVIPVTWEDSNLQYVTYIHQRTPLVPVKLVLDLGGQFLWVTCKQNFTSSTYRPARCHSAQCSLAATTECGQCFTSPNPGCNNTCSVNMENPLLGLATSGDVGEDVLSVPSTNGFNRGRNVAVPRFIFSCGSTFLLKGHGDDVSGMAGLGRTKIALPSQFSSAFNFPRKFAICLSSNSRGVVFFGDGPYVFHPNVNAAQSLTYTPLILNQPSKAYVFEKKIASSEYYIGVKSIKVDGKVVPKIRTRLLSINKEGKGGTKISTLHPYMVLEESIYKAVTKAFVGVLAARNITTVEENYSRFEYCFSKHSLRMTRLGPAVPTIELVLENGVIWPIFGANSMAKWFRDDELCLAIDMADEHNPTTASIVIGGYQLENNLVQFDLESSRLGFSSLLFEKKTTCGSFNFNSGARTAPGRRPPSEFRP